VLGDRDRAIELVEKLLTMPGYINYGRLKLHPLWSPLPGDPRFGKIVASFCEVLQGPLNRDFLRITTGGRYLYFVFASLSSARP
jgi:hypothetical protein